MKELEAVDILLIEDSDTDAEMTLRALKRKGLANNVTWVKDGAEALDFIYRRNAYAGRGDGHPKLVLLDLKLPKIDGIEVLRTLKSDPLTQAIPVVMLTSSAEERDIVESYRLGVNSYIVKPVDMKNFLEEVAKAGCYWLVVNKIPG
ncbi:MAG: response regulator [Burkholderiales bacterium]|nr:response regulator [Burkholderiales bacterium]